MGNSEVGHMNIGAGRVVYQDYTKIEHAIETGEFFDNPQLTRAVETGQAAMASPDSSQVAVWRSGSTTRRRCGNEVGAPGRERLTRARSARSWIWR